MKDILTVMKFTIKDMVKRKSFIVSTLIILMLIVIGFNIPNILESFDEDNIKDKILIIDKNNIFDGSLESLNNLGLSYEIIVSDDNYEEIKAKIDSGDIYSGLIIENENNNIKMTYIVENLLMTDGMPESLINAIMLLNRLLQRHRCWIL